MSSFNTTVIFVVFVSLTLAFIISPFVRDYQQNKKLYWVCGAVLLFLYFVGAFK